MTVVTELRQTCVACPSQWEGRTEDGRHVYVHYRRGWLTVGFGATLEEALDDETISAQLGDTRHGFMTFEELVRITENRVDWFGRRRALAH